MSESLLKRVAVGDSSAVQECIERYGGLIWSLARTMCPNEADVEDAVQEIFVSLWNSASRFNESLASETTFVAMIARRRLIDSRRRLAVRPDRASLNEESIGAVDIGTFRVDENDDAAQAARALAELRPEQQRVLQLSIVHGKTYEQIAESTGLPLGTVKTHARRGLIRIREILSRGQSDAAMEVAS